MQIIETREELDALDKGTTMRDESGYYVTKDRHGDYTVIHPAYVENGMTLSACEIAGEYTDNKASRFFPLTVIGHCWYCDSETSRHMYDEAGEDWSCTAIHDDPK